ncbi:MAG: HAMP domain-containing protein [Evtepia gabavorous]
MPSRPSPMRESSISNWPASWRFRRTSILNVAYDISSIYQTRRQQQQAHGKIFAILLVVCAGLSYSIAWFLTRPLDKLSQTAQALAAGDLSRRSGVQTQDELGALARRI